MMLKVKKHQVGETWCFSFTTSLTWSWTRFYSRLIAIPIETTSGYFSDNQAVTRLLSERKHTTP